MTEPEAVARVGGPLLEADVLAAESHEIFYFLG